MPMTKSLIIEALRGLLDRDGRSLQIRTAAACDNHASVSIAAGDRDPETIQALSRAAIEAIRAAAGAAGERVESLSVEFLREDGSVAHAASVGSAETQVPTRSAPATNETPSGHRPIVGLADRTGTERSRPASRALPGVRHIIAVGAGKGGVGKSTVAVNLAVGLARRGHAVGLLDGDIYGPSIPTLLGLGAMEQVVHAGKLQPFYVHGVKAVTMGKLVDADKPLIWRGPMAHGAFKQLAEQTDWGELDYLVIDLPPGTGDVPLTMAQVLQLTGAVIVCTPQRVAQDDAVRATQMFRQLRVEVLGVVENMSYFVAEDLTPPREYDLFGRGGAEKMAARLSVPFLGSVPLAIALRENSDRGDPSANFSRGAAKALVGALETMVTNVENQAALAAVRQGQTRPTLSIS